MTRQFQRTQAAQTTTPATTEAKISFPRGVMHVNGIAQMATRTIERLSSNEMTRYVAVEWADPGNDEVRYSCNCPGWANRRTCKHVKELADNPQLGLITSDRVSLPATITATPTFRPGVGRRRRGLSFE